MNSNEKQWYFSVDRGGTFTDIVGFDPEGRAHTHKLLSISDAYEDAGIAGIRTILNLSPENPLDPNLIGSIRIGTTVATNALLERKGAPAALCITKGFEDLLAIGNGTRPELFNLGIDKPSPIYSHVCGIEETIDTSGAVLTELDPEKAEKSLQEIRSLGYENLAIVLKHSWINPLHEKKLIDIARQKAGFRHVVASHEVMPLINFLKRGQTTMIEAYLGPVLFNYANTLKKLAGPIKIEFMQSSGGLVSADNLHAKDTILSGPAGGVTGTARLSEQLGVEQVIGFDMGGTSTDVSRYDGDLNHVFESSVAGVPFYTDMLDVETVAAGGGSIFSFDGERLLVGPESAGSNPGPACYGLDGPLTVTDANLLLGRIIPKYIPNVFGTSHDKRLDKEKTKEKFRALATTVSAKTGHTYTPEKLAEGYLRIANEIMCRAMKKISISRGYDIRDHALMCFGGAAPQHACDMARILGIKTIIVHPFSSVLSAYGIALADRLERTVLAVMEVLTTRLLQRLEKKAETEAGKLAERLRDEGNKAEITTRLFLDLRPKGSDSWLSIPAGTGRESASFENMKNIVSRFKKEYFSRFGFRPDADTIEVVNMRTEVSSASFVPSANTPSLLPDKPAPAHARSSCMVWISGKYRRVPVLDRTSLKPGHQIDGPAMIVDDQLTLFVQEGFETTIDAMHNLILRDETHTSETMNTKQQNDSERPDPIMLEVFNNLFMNIAEQMGYTLANTAHSVNMKERLDFSCALFDDKGKLIAHAPHIPVHLGAMEATVRHIIKENRDTMKKGDMYLANNPHQGGSHLPDITIVTPVFCEENTPSYYLANRGHHADIGGITPGSMPPSSRTIQDEGIVVGTFLLVREGTFREKEVLELLSSGDHPARNLSERLSDLKAQVAANNKGMTELMRMNTDYGTPTVLRYMSFIRKNAKHAVNRALERLAGTTGTFESTFSDSMDNGAVIAVSIRITAAAETEPKIVVDFTGTSAEDQGNINAPAAVTTAAVLYALRCLIEENIPLNAGCLEPVTIIIPEGSLLNPSSGAAVAVGNVETSQRIVDVLLGALGRAAASQGTMNNLLFGKPDNTGSQYYETIPGGSGATEGHNGASGVQVHMTNTRLTDPEILEQRFPTVRITRFAMRKGSGGTGRWNGGEGIERALRFNEPMHVSVISERRVTAPFGLHNGSDGAKGINLLISPDGTETRLEHKVDRIFESGETILIKTPGGGGYGKPNT
ncbi:hydantoinase B/oxoprolinase family protein [Prosthecochloris sp.]|uniref:hydantoinase B/oxoprolinase family protein n=1 Tax=Prosthecochloris sp. TaxID=290513 RepID=UPI00257C3EAB|nr:hydantoinase B/oxoprolinase family protein [Prosthecochloris sp.]